MWRLAVALLMGACVSLAAGACEVRPSIPSPSASPGPGRGPQPTVVCPGGAVPIAPGQSIQGAVNANPGGTAFCLEAGIHQVPTPITPKNRDAFIGEFGAVLDGSTTAFAPIPPPEWQGLITAHNQDIDHVTVRNLVIRDSPQRGVHGYTDDSDGWVIENNEFANNRIAISHGNSFRISRNFVHDSHQYGITSYRSHGSVIEDNTFSSNATQGSAFPGASGASKWTGTRDIAVRDNWWIGNHGSGIWFDFLNTGILVEGNRVTGNLGSGVSFEVSGRSVVRENVLIGNHREDIFIGGSHDLQVYGNTIETIHRGISLFQDGARISQGELTGNDIHHNSITVRPGTRPLAISFTCLNLGSAPCSSYATDRGNRVDGNVYGAPAPAGLYWFAAGGSLDWRGWQALGFDIDGSVR